MTSPWQKKFELLSEYKDVHGNCRVPTRYGENQPLARWAPLARWVKTMRAEYRKYQKGGKTSLVIEQITKLNDLGFEWELRRQPTKTIPWETHMEKLRVYKEANGHCRVPMLYKENQPLANWVKSTRIDYKKHEKGVTTTLTTEHIADLNDLGFEWELRRTGRGEPGNVIAWIPWETRIEELEEYKEEHGHCQVPSNWEENQSLATWAYNTKYQYAKLQNGEKSPLTEERVAELDELGFDWEIPGGFRAGRSKPMKIIPWETHVDHLKEYKKVHKNCRVPRHSKKYRKLAIWVSNTRQEHAKLKKGGKSSLTEKRIAELNGLGFDWTPGGGSKTPDSGEESSEDSLQDEEGEQEVSATEREDRQSERPYRHRKAKGRVSS